MSEWLEAQLTRVHATPHRMVMNFAGAGSLALYWLHRVGGSSRTVLEATDRYAPRSLIEAVGFTPERFTSPEAALALARRALERAAWLDPQPPLFGLGSSATIATDRDKRGEHRLAAAVCDALGDASYELVLTKGARSRAEEEELVSLILLRAVSEACGLLNFPELPLLPGESLETAFAPAPDLERLASGEVAWVKILPDGTRSSGQELPGQALLSGSFNPLHDGHRRLARVAAQRLGQEVVFELPLLNADKAPIDLAEARRRALQFSGVGALLLSRAPLFEDKARLFPSSTFVMGADTAARLAAPRFYGDDPAAARSALETLKRQGTRILVAGRRSQGEFRTLAGIAIPSLYAGLFDAIPESLFNMDISSSELREHSS